MGSRNAQFAASIWHRGTLGRVSFDPLLVSRVVGLRRYDLDRILNTIHNRAEYIQLTDVYCQYLGSPATASILWVTSTTSIINVAALPPRSRLTWYALGSAGNTTQSSQRGALVLADFIAGSKRRLVRFPKHTRCLGLQALSFLDYWGHPEVVSH